MDLDDLDMYLSDEIIEKRKVMKTYYEVIADIDKYGIEVVFGEDTIQNSLKSAFDAGRGLGQREGELDALQEIDSLVTSWIMRDIE